MSPTIAELLEALPIDDEETLAADHMLQNMLADATRPVPTGRPRRLWALSTLQGRIAAAYFAWWLRQFFQDDDARAAALNETHLRNAIRLLGGMGYLRGAVMKVGQLLAAWPDVVPSQFAEMLGQLHFQAPPMHFELLREFVFRELGDEPENLFDAFETEAIAAASLGQVHRARLRGSGRPVAIKIQYPNIASAIRDDLATLRAIALPMRLGRDGDSLKRQLDDIGRMLDREVDYEHEAENLRRARAVFRESDSIIVPRVVEELSTSRVLTMDYLEGAHLPEFLEGNPSQADRDRFGELITRSNMRLWYEAHMCYADVHPGNFLWMPGGSLGLLDFGCCHRFTPRDVSYVTQVEGSLGGGDAAVRDALLASIELDEVDDEGRMALLREYCDWLWEPVRTDAAFDFSDDSYFKRGMRIYGEVVKRRYIRSRPVNTWIGRTFIGLRAILTQLRARVAYGRILREETTMA